MKAVKMTKAAAKRKFGSYYRIAQVVGRNRSVVGRWGKYVPEQHVATLEAAQGKVK